jgi:hypothetical protein
MMDHVVYFEVGAFHIVTKALVADPRSLRLISYSRHLKYVRDSE